MYMKNAFLIFHYGPEGERCGLSVVYADAKTIIDNIVESVEAKRNNLHRLAKECDKLIMKSHEIASRGLNDKYNDDISALKGQKKGDKWKHSFAKRNATTPQEIALVQEHEDKLAFNKEIDSKIMDVWRKRNSEIEEVVAKHYVSFVEPRFVDMLAELSESDREFVKKNASSFDEYEFGVDELPLFGISIDGLVLSELNQEELEKFLIYHK